MISLELSSIQQKDAERAMLARAMAEFEGRAGVIQSIATSFEFVPKPLIQAEPAPRDQREVLRSESYARQMAEQVAKQEVEDRIRKLAETMTYQEVMAATGYSQSTLYRISRAGCFHFRRKPTEVKNKRAYIDPAIDARMCDRLKALRDVGLNRHQVAKQMQVSSSVISRLLRDYGIDFPVVKAGRPREAA